MNNEDFLNSQELNNQDYSNVCGGGTVEMLALSSYTILPVGPLRPKKPDSEVEP